MRRRPRNPHKFIVVTLLALVLFATASGGVGALCTPTPTTPVTAQPDVKLDVIKGHTGKSVTASGSGFPSAIRVLLAYDEMVLRDISTLNDGTLEDTTIWIPESTAGDHKVRVIRASDGKLLADELFTVEPELTLEPDRGRSGSIVMARGTGYASESDIDFGWSSRVGAGVTVAASFSASSGCNGTFNVALTVRAEVAMEATVTVTATDSRGNSAWADFTVVVPKVDLLSPTYGATDIGTKPLFEWTGVEDATGYSLLVDDDPAFGSPVIDEDLGLQQTYHPAAALAYETTYSWRVVASGVDWTSPPADGIFTTIPSWPEPVQTGTPWWIWVLIVIGALLAIAVIVLIVRTRRAV